MNLPELALQVGYGRIGWAIVASAAMINLTPAARRMSRLKIWACMLAAAVLVALPGAASYAHWLGLAFQYPSALLVGCCIASLWMRLHGDRLVYQMPPRLAIAIVPAGALLYLDAVGWLSHGYYFWGFSPYAAPGFALAASIGCVVAIARAGLRPSTLALLTALSLFTLLRLPSGNLWDALLDPLLWGWACACVFAMLRKQRAGRRPVPVPVTAPVMAATTD